MKLMIIDDHTLVRKGVISMLLNKNNISSIEEAANIQDSIVILEKEKPDIALVDFKLGEDCGLEIVEKGRKVSSTTKFVILTSFIPREDFMAAENVGVDGYILKNAYIEDILYAINVVIRGKKYYDPDIMKYKDNIDSEHIFNQLTVREKDVLNELGKGLSNEEIAGRLYISENTVKKHVSSILSKLNFTHRTQIVALVNSKQCI